MLPSILTLRQFGLYLAFPIGWMYYFGTNLDERFKVPDFWPTQEQSHKLPYDKEDIKAEIDRMNRAMQEREQIRRAETERAFDGFRAGVRDRGGKGDGEG
jgi:protein PET100, fungi type